MTNSIECSWKFEIATDNTKQILPRNQCFWTYEAFSIFSYAMLVRKGLKSWLIIYDISSSMTKRGYRTWYIVYIYTSIPRNGIHTEVLMSMYAIYHVQENMFLWYILVRCD